MVYKKVPANKSFGTIILEKVVDLIWMFEFLLLTVIFKFKAIVSFYDFVIEQKIKNKFLNLIFLKE